MIVSQPEAPFAAGAAREPQTADVRRLFLGKVPHDFDPQRDVAIGAWCFLGATQAHPVWENLKFYDAFESTDDLAADKTRVAALCEALVRDLAPRFNATHNVNHGTPYWRILLLPWLLWVVQAVWKRYCHVEEFQERNRGHLFVVDVCENARPWDVVDLIDFHHRVLGSDSFNGWLTSKIVLRLAPSGWQLNAKPGMPRADAPTVPHSSRKGRVVGFLRRLLYDQRCRRVYGVIWTSVLISAYLAVLPRKMPRPRDSLGEPLRAAEARFPRAFIDVLYDVLWKVVPGCLAADYARHEAQASRRRYRRGKVNLVGPVLILNEYEKFLLAHAVENGELVVCTQHGSSGYQRLNINSIEIENRQDAYLSWGWQAQDEDAGRVIAVPSPVYSAIRDRYRGGGSALIFVGTSARVFAHRLETAPQPAQTIDYLKDKVSLLEALDIEPRRSLLYRPYLSDSGAWDDETYLADRFPDLAFLKGSSRDLHRRLMTCRLLVSDHYGTTFGMGMVANVPTLGFWNPKVWELSRKAGPVFEGLACARVIHSSGLEAAEQINRIWDDVLGWWNSHAVQAARLEFLDHYARTDRLWLWRWLVALWRL